MLTVEQILNAPRRRSLYLEFLGGQWTEQVKSLHHKSNYASITDPHKRLGHGTVFFETHHFSPEPDKLLRLMTDK